METPPGSDAGPTWSRGAALIVGATFAFALMAIFSRSADAPVLAVAAWRAVIVAVVFGGWALWDGGLSSLKPDASTLRTGVPYGLALALASSTFVGGYALTTVANTVFLHSLAPLFVFPLAAWAFGERASPRALLGTGVAVLGVALLSGVSIFHVSRYTDTRFLLGDFLALLSAAGYGAVLVGTRAARRTEAPMVPTLFVAWSVAAVVLCALALVMGQLAIPLRALGWVLALAIVSTNVPFFLLTLGMRSVGAGLASLLAMAEVVFATALGVVVYGESLAPIGWVGAVLVVVGIAQPFLREPAATADGDLVPASRRARLLRLGLRLLVLNAGAGLALVGGAESGVLLAWAAIASALHLGPPLMDRAGWVARLAPGGLALVVMIGLALRGGWTDPDPPWAVVVTAVLAWGADRWLARREDPAEVDLDSLGSAALLLVASGALLARSGHAGGPLLLLLAAISVCAGAASALGGHELRARVERVLAAVSQPPRLAAGAAVLLIAGGVSVVPTGHVGVVERLGSPLAEPVSAGLAVRLPPPLERLTLVNVAEVRRTPLATAETPLLTLDGALVSLEVGVHWTVADPLPFALHSADPAAALGALARAALVQSVARLPLDTVLTSGRAALEAEVAASAQAAADRAGLGLRVDAVQLSAVAVPAPVLAAFLDVISASEYKRELINVAEAYHATVVPTARGSAVAALEAARGNASTVQAEAEGRRLLVRALAEGGAPAPALNRHRTWTEGLTEQLSGRSLVLAPSSVHVWFDGAEATPGVLPVPPRGAARAP